MNRNDEYFQQRMEYADKEIAVLNKQTQLFIDKIKRLESENRRLIELKDKYKKLSEDALKLAERSSSDSPLVRIYRDGFNRAIRNEISTVRRKMNNDIIERSSGNG